MRLENLRCRSAFLRDFVADEAHIFKDLIDQACLGHSERDRFIVLNFVGNIDAKKILDIAFVFEQKFGGKALAEVGDGFVAVGENEAIIHVKHDQAVLSDKEAWIDLGLDEAASEKALG